MELHTARLRLDALRRDDAAVLFAYRGDMVACRYQGWHPASVAEAAAFIERQLAAVPATPGSWQQFAIRPRGGDELIGDLGLHFVDADTMEIGITLAQAWRSCGYAREALHAALVLIFDTLGRRRVIARVDPRHAACIRLLQHLGLQSSTDAPAMAGDDGKELIFAVDAPVWRAMRAGQS